MSQQITATALHRMTLAELQVLHHRLLQILATVSPGSAADRETRITIDAVRRMIRRKQHCFAPRF